MHRRNGFFPAVAQQNELQKKYLFGVFAAVLLWLTVQAAFFHPDAENTAPAVPEDGLTVLVEEQYPPFSYSDEKGELKGFNVEVAQGICRELGTVCRIRPVQFERIIPLLEAGEADLAVAGMSMTPERREKLAFSEVYYRSRSFFITRDPEVGLITSANCRGLSIGVQAGTVQAASLAGVFEPLGAKVRTYEEFPAVIRALEEGEVSAVLTDGLPGYSFLKSPEGERFYIGGSVDDIESSLTQARVTALRTRAPLIGAVNRAIESLKEKGDYQVLNLRYFSFINY